MHETDFGKPRFGKDRHPTEADVYIIPAHKEKHHKCEKPPEKEPFNCDTYVLTEEMLCIISRFIEPMVDSKIQAKINELLETFKPLIDVATVLFSGISIWSLPEGDGYNCFDTVIFDGKLYQSKINQNKRHPHDTDTWYLIGSINEIIAKLYKENTDGCLCIQLHHTCVDDDCKTIYDLNECVAAYKDTGEVDACGNAITEVVYYQSLTDNNMTVPAEGESSWKGPFTACEVLGGAFLTCDSLCHTIVGCCDDNNIIL